MSPVPNLIHPVPVVLEQINRSQTHQDADAREPVQQAKRGTRTTLQGQAMWTSQYKVKSTKTGVEQEASGYVLFRTADLAALGITLQPEDRFKSIGGVDTDVYIIKLDWKGHYPDQGGPTLVKAWFMDRQPSKQTRG